jgi:hypothetical protein
MGFPLQTLSASKRRSATSAKAPHQPFGDIAERPGLCRPTALVRARFGAESYDDFLADADARLKKHLSRQQFDDMCGRYTQALKKDGKVSGVWVL